MSESELLTFPQWLKRRRGALGWTQADLAEAVNCALITIKRIENGSLRPSPQLAALLAEKTAVPAPEQPHFITFARTEEATMPAMAFWPAPPADSPPLFAPLNNLPAALTPTIGREAHIAAACALLGQAAVRLLTLTGPPGTGKTRLSLEVARALQPDFAHGVCFVPLAPVRDDDCVVPAIIQALGLPENKGQTAAEQLHSYLADKQMLLVLDNFEQIVDSAHYLTDLLRHAPHLRLIVSSREWLNCYGEYEFPVPPLGLPDVRHLPPPEQLADYSAVALFVARAQAANPTFILDERNSHIVAEICTQLDGLPLALEMAAARLRRFTADQIKDQLAQRLAHLAGPRDFSPRQQTLRGAIDWSYDLLTEEEQSLFAHAALFLSGTAEALARVWDTGQTPAQVEAMLHTLADKSLLRLTRPAHPNSAPLRFSLLYILREYGLEQLHKQGVWAAAQERYITYYVEWIEAMAPANQRALQNNTAAFAALDQEADDWQEALYWASTTAAIPPELSLRMIVILHQYWDTRGQYREAARLARLALAHPASSSTTIRARALSCLSYHLRTIGQMDEALHALQEAIALHQHLGDTRGEASGLHHLGQHYGMQQDYAQAAVYLRQSLALYHHISAPLEEAQTLGSLGRALMHLGVYDEAEAVYTEALRLRRHLQDEYGVAHCLHGLAELANLRKDYVRATALIREAISTRHHLGHRRHLANSVGLYGEILMGQGQFAEGVRLIGYMVALLDEMGIQPSDSVQRVDLLAQVDAAVGTAAAAQWLAEGAALTTAEVCAMAIREQLTANS